MRTIYNIILALCLLAGIGLYASSFRYQWYTVSEQEMGRLSQRLADKPREVRWREWYSERKALEPPRKSLHDAGIGLMALAVTLGVLRFISGFPLKDARTPKNRWSFMGLFLLALALQVPASVYYLGHRQSRFEYPTWGDSTGIGLVQTVFGCIVSAVIGTLFFLLVLRKATLPANLYVWSGSRPVSSTIITLLFAVPAVLCLLLIDSPIRDGSIGGVIMTMTMLYLFMSARAGMVQHGMAGAGLPEPSSGQESG